jgi:beta-hydroxylase
MSFIYSIDEYKFLYTIQEAWKEILDEYKKAVATIKVDSGFVNNGLVYPWPEKDLYDKGWKAIGLVYKGRDDYYYTQQVREQFPLTNKLVKAIPGVYIAGFSILEPKTRIYPHTGYTSDVFRSHLGLICPKGAYLEVNGERIEWEEGKMFVFDDMVTHNAYNGSDEERVILMVDFHKTK